MLNSTCLVGRLTKDPELRYTPSNQAVATFSLAVNRNFKGQNGEREADFINCVIWRQPCESWSNASAMSNGNACWKQEDLSDSLFIPQREASMFTIRNSSDYDKAYINYQYDRQFMKRVNGELCAFNTIEIIKRYEPRYFIIENPASGRLWKYIKDVMGFNLPYLNMTRYNNYDYPLQKPTKFASNLDLGLKNDIIKQDVEWKHFSKSYNERSNIPQNLVIEIFTKVYNEFLQEK